MSKLIVDFTPILEINPHPNADRLEIAKIKGWQVVVQKERFEAGDNVIYIPPDAILPKYIHEHLGITKYLAELPKGYGGLDETERPTARRVRAARLRGEASFGTVMTPVDATILAGLSDTANFSGWDEVEDIAAELGITKWEPPMKSTQGDQERDIVTFHRYTDVENWRNFPDILKGNEKVAVTEKLHGTNCRLGWVRDTNSGYNEHILVAGSHNTRRKEVDDKGRGTLYWEPFKWYPKIIKMLKSISEVNNDANVVLFGEIFGSSVQDMTYGMSNGQKDFRAFDISVDGEYLNFDVKRRFLVNHDIPMVPVLWTGPYQADKINELTDGDSTFPSAKGFKGREGVVVTPIFERKDAVFGRIILKSISADYLARKGATDSH